MATLEEIKNICSKPDNSGMSEHECSIYEKYQNSLYWAWENWDNEVIKSFWSSEEKPEEPTRSFKEDYFYNFDWTEEFNLEA